MVFRVGGSNPAIFRPGEAPLNTEGEITFDHGAVAPHLLQQSLEGWQIFKCLLVLLSWMTVFQWFEALNPLELRFTL